MLQKIYIEDFTMSRESKNLGQGDRYNIKNNHQAIVSAEIFNGVQRKYGYTSKAST